MPDLASDMIDSAAGLDPCGATRQLRQQRSKVVVASRGSLEALFAPALDGLTLSERFLVALYACHLSSAAELAQRYQERNHVDGIGDELMKLIERAERDDAALAAVSTARELALLRYTRQLIDRPVAGERAAMEALSDAGLSTRGIVALAQLLGFVSYQARLVAGLKALEALEQEQPG